MWDSFEKHESRAEFHYHNTRPVRARFENDALHSTIARTGVKLSVLYLQNATQLVLLPLP